MRVRFSVRKRSRNNIGKRKVGHRWSIVTQLRVIGVIEIKSDVGERTTFFLYGPTEPPIYSVGSVLNTKLALEKNSTNCLYDIKS